MFNGKYYSAKQEFVQDGPRVVVDNFSQATADNQGMHVNGHTGKQYFEYFYPNAATSPHQLSLVSAVTKNRRKNRRKKNSRKQIKKNRKHNKK